jgi:ribosomal protein L11 methyltransferase
MKYLEKKVTICSDNIPFALELVSNIFYDFGVKGLVIYDPEDLTPTKARARPDHHAITGYSPINDKTAQRCIVFEEKLQQLERKYRIETAVTYCHVDEEDWSESWKTYFKTEKISEKMVIKPTWRQYHAKKDEIILEIDPGMAFGTGTHPTTSLCLNMLEKYLKPGDSFLDVGTGSGILSIAAAKLGAQKITGIDNDDVAVEVAKSNLLQNKIEKKTFRIVTGNLVDMIHERYDLVVSNILSEVILDLLDHIKKVLVKGGIFMASGIIVKHKAPVVEKMIKSGFRILEIRTKEDWVSIAGCLGRDKPR